jgi:periplasmic protein TonB
MNNSIYEELDQQVEALLQHPDAESQAVDLTGLLEIANDLRYIAQPVYRAELRTALLGKVFVASTMALPQVRTIASAEQTLPTLFGTGSGTYRMQRTNFVASALIHTAALALIASSGMWVARTVQRQNQAVTMIEPYVPETLTVSRTVTAGGGGGGDRDKVPAPLGHLPKQSREQFTPPAMVIRNEHPKLAVAPTVVAPPIDIAANMPNLGDPYTHVPSGPPSNGSGSGGGVGAGSGGGVGAGYGPGVGPGIGGGYGGGIYRVGGGVSAPRVLFAPDPEYSDEARKAKFQGTVVLWAVIGPDGRTKQMRVARSLGLGLDQRAMDAVQRWRFEPAMKDGRAVAVQVNIEVNFRLY